MGWERGEAVRGAHEGLCPAWTQGCRSTGITGNAGGGQGPLGGQETAGGGVRKEGCLEVCRD